MWWNTPFLKQGQTKSERRSHRRVSFSSLDATSFAVTFDNNGVHGSVSRRYMDRSQRTRRFMDTSRFAGEHRPSIFIKVDEEWLFLRVGTCQSFRSRDRVRLHLCSFIRSAKTPDYDLLPRGCFSVPRCVTIFGFTVSRDALLDSRTERPLRNDRSLSWHIVDVSDKWLAPFSRFLCCQLFEDYRTWKIEHFSKS